MSGSKSDFFGFAPALDAATKLDAAFFEQHPTVLGYLRKPIADEMPPVQTYGKRPLIAVIQVEKGFRLRAMIDIFSHLPDSMREAVYEQLKL